MILAIECSSRFLECFADYIYILNFLSHWHIYDKKLQSCVEMETKITRYCIDFDLVVLYTFGYLLYFHPKLGLRFFNERMSLGG